MACEHNARRRSHSYIRRRREGPARFPPVVVFQNKPDLKVKAFCAQCNNSSMNDLDRDVHRYAAIPYIPFAASGSHFPLTAQELLASWICKIAMVADQAGKEPGFTQSDREYLYLLSEASSRRLDLGCRREAATGPVGSLVADPQASVRRGLWCINTFGVNHLVAQTFVPPLREIAKPRPGPTTTDLLSQIWPRTPETKAWPPTLLIRREDLPELTRAFITDFDYI